jgi:hypothetical protein
LAGIRTSKYRSLAAAGERFIAISFTGGQYVRPADSAASKCRYLNAPAIGEESHCIASALAELAEEFQRDPD